MTAAADRLIEDCGRVVERARLESLLSRGFLDRAAMRGALASGGRAAGVLANGLESAVMNRENRNLVLDGRLVLVSPYDPGAGFNVGHAMQRNKVVYALSDAALVVNAEVGKGGTWAGAVEQLERLGLVPVYVRSTGDPHPGLDALRERGALPWPNPEDGPGFNAALRVDASPDRGRASQVGLSFVVEQEVREPGPQEGRQAPGESHRADAASAPKKRGQELQQAHLFDLRSPRGTRK